MNANRMTKITIDIWDFVVENIGLSQTAEIRKCYKEHTHYENTVDHVVDQIVKDVENLVSGPIMINLRSFK